MPKEGPRIKLAISFPTTKNQELTQFPCVQVAWNILLESSQRGYNFASNFISIENLHAKLWGPKVAWVLTLAISEQNVIWMWASWVATKYTIKGKVVASPMSRLWWVLWVRVCPWLILTPKVLQLCMWAMDYSSTNS